MRTQWPSPAKLNLFLYITGQRADGYHTLQTLFQFLDYGDTISIELRDDGDIRLLTPVEGVEHDRSRSEVVDENCGRQRASFDGKRCEYQH